MTTGEFQPDDHELQASFAELAGYIRTVIETSPTAHVPGVGLMAAQYLAGLDGYVGYLNATLVPLMPRRLAEAGQICIGRLEIGGVDEPVETQGSLNGVLDEVAGLDHRIHTYYLFRTPVSGEYALHEITGTWVLGEYMYADMCAELETAADAALSGEIEFDDADFAQHKELMRELCGGEPSWMRAIAEFLEEES